MRVFFDATAIPAQPTGVGTYVHSLLPLLDASDDVTLKVAVREDDAARYCEFLPGSELLVVQLRSRWRRLVWEQTGLARAAGSWDADLIHCPHYTMPLGTRIPRVVVFHDMTFFDTPEMHDAIKVRMFRTFMRIAVRRCARIVAVSNTTRGEAVTRLGVDPERVDVVPHGIDLGPYEGLRSGRLAEVRTRYSINGPFALYLGTIEPRKNLPRLIDAYVSLRAAGTIEHKLVLAGRMGWKPESFEQALDSARRAGVGDDIVQLGYVDEADKPALLGAADVFAYVSIAEGFGLPVLEAMAAGTAVLTSNVSATAEVAGDAALTVDPGDTERISAGLERLLGDVSIRDDLVSRGHARTHRYSWEHAARLTVEAYEQTLRRSGSLPVR